ncbi:MAG TPA: flavin reductase family protein [Gemmatimonadaceae bacterium]|nr:flavin reductase family protein [Gemmatimonadaceae bacterium]
MPSGPITPDAFRDVLGRFATGVTVLTTRDAEGRDRGMTVSAFAALSLEPPLVLVCVARDATIAGAVAAASHFGVSVLAAHQEPLARRFADPNADRFDAVPLSRGASGVALVRGALAHLECRATARHEGGDHTIVVGEVLAASALEGEPLVHFRGDYGRFAR